MRKSILPVVLVLLALAVSACLRGGSESVHVDGEAVMVFGVGSHR